MLATHSCWARLTARRAKRVTQVLKSDPERKKLFKKDIASLQETLTRIKKGVEVMWTEEGMHIHWIHKAKIVGNMQKWRQCLCQSLIEVVLTLSSRVWVDGAEEPSRETK